MAEPAEYAFHHQHRGVHDQPEIDGTDREQVRRFASQNHDPDGEEEREGNGGSDDDGAAQIAEKHPLQQKDQKDTNDHVVQDRVRGYVDQVLAIVDALDTHAGRQDIRAINALYLLVHALDGWRALLAAPHEDDALHDIIRGVHAGDAEARLVPDGDRRHIAHQDWIAAGLRQHGVAEIVHAADQADAPHHRDLRPDVDRVAADIDVAVVERLQH